MKKLGCLLLLCIGFNLLAMDQDIPQLKGIRFPAVCILYVASISQASSSDSLAELQDCPVSPVVRKNVYGRCPVITPSPRKRDCPVSPVKKDSNS